LLFVKFSRAFFYAALHPLPILPITLVVVVVVVVVGSLPRTPACRKRVAMLGSIAFLLIAAITVALIQPFVNKVADDWIVHDWLREWEKRKK